MRLRHIVVSVTLGALAVMVTTSAALEYKAQKRSAELWEKVQRAAKTGTARTQVELALGAEGLPFFYSAPSNVIISPWIPVGRYRLLWKTQFYYQISFNDQGLVTGFTTQRFNEGM